jgi:hypothetical protein
MVVDMDSVTLWIRIRIGNPDPDRGARKMKKFQWKMHFLVNLKKPLKRYRYLEKSTNYFLKKF